MVSLVLSSVSTAAVAQDAVPPSCWDTAMAQPALTRCADAEARESRTRLDSLMSELRRQMDSTRGAELLRVHEAWLTFAQAQCRWAGDEYAGGSMRPMVVLVCPATETERRIAALRAFLCGPEPDPAVCEAARKYDPPPGRKR
jgi:uncharacterized protein YecT (DUF1311 family)